MSNPIRAAFQNRMSAFVAGFILAVALGPSLLLLFWRPYTPLGDYPVPQLVLNRVAGVAGPAAYQGERVLVRGSKCVAGNETVNVYSEWVLVRQNPRSTSVLGNINTVREPGCREQVYENRLPPVVAPGVYRIEGYDEAVKGRERQQRAWFTEWFTILEPGG